MKLNFHKNHKLLFGTVFWVYLFLSIIIAVAPALWVQDQAEPLPWDEPLTELQRKGLSVYINEGCVYCHTQQVRPLKMDKVWGRGSIPADYAYIGRPSVWRQTPAVLGSSRIGPDLTNIGKRQPSKTWQYMHLWNPRSVVKASIMPAYHWLFKVVKNPSDSATVVPVPEKYAPESGKVVPTKRAKALVAYLLSLKQEPLSPPASFSGKTDSADSKKAVAQKASDLNGKALYITHCSTCHQANGQGISGAFPPLVDDPVVIAEDPTAHIRIVLYGLQGKTINGVSYPSLMTPFKDILSNAEIAAIINHERTSWGNNAPTITAEDVKKVRNNPKLGKIQPNK